MIRRRPKADKLPGAPAWMVTYADMVTLCLTFFVLLYSFSTLDALKWKTVVLSVQGALGPLDGGTGVLEGPPASNGADSGEKAEEETKIQDQERVEEFLKYQEEMKKLESIKTALGSFLQNSGVGNSVTINMEERGLVLRFQDSVLFDKGRADILEQARDVLDKVSGVLKEVPNPIRIEGHTDDLPIRTARFPSNWELSTTRATNVLRYMIDKGMPPARLSAVGYGEFHPIAANDSEDDRRKNRRVDIVIIRESLIINEPK